MSGAESQCPSYILILYVYFSSRKLDTPRPPSSRAKTCVPMRIIISVAGKDLLQRDDQEERTLTPNVASSRSWPEGGIETRPPSCRLTADEQTDCAHDELFGFCEGFRMPA